MVPGLTRIAVPVLLVAGVLFPNPSSALPVLKLEDTRFEGGGVQFDVQPAERHNPDFNPNADTVRRFAVGEARISIDFAKIRPAKYGAYRYDFYLSTPQSEAAPLRYSAFAHSEGGFRDSLVDVPIRLTLDGETHEDTVKLPIYNTTAPPFLEVRETQTTPITTVGTSRLILPFRNTLDVLDVRLVAEGSPRSRHQERWNDLQLLSADQQSWKEIAIGANDSTSLQLAVQPNPWETVLATVLPASEHDRILLPLKYQSLENGPFHNLDIILPIRFQPPWWVTLAVVVIGSLVGNLLLRLAKGKRVGRWPVKTTFGALLASVTWLLLVGTGTSLQILGKTLEPNDLLPAFIVGVLTVLAGRRILRWLEGLAPVGDAHQPAGADP